MESLWKKECVMPRFPKLEGDEGAGADTCGSCFSRDVTVAVSDLRSGRFPEAGAVSSAEVFKHNFERTSNL